MLAVTMMSISTTNNTKADTTPKGGARRCVPPRPFEFIKDERCMNIIRFIDHSTIFDTSVGHEKDLSTYSIFYFFDTGN